MWEATHLRGFKDGPALLEMALRMVENNERDQQPRT